MQERAHPQTHTPTHTHVHVYTLYLVALIKNLMVSTKPGKVYHLCPWIESQD